MRLVLLGPPGAGKGTQGQGLAAHFGVPHVATGDIVRDHIVRQTDFGRKIEAAIAAGNFASDEDILFWVGQRLSEPDAQNGYILDGFPRDLAQAEAFQSSLDAVFWLAVSDQTLIERMTGRQVCPRCGSVYHVVHCPPRSLDNATVTAAIWYAARKTLRKNCSIVWNCTKASCSRWKPTIAHVHC